MHRSGSRLGLYALALSFASLLLITPAGAQTEPGRPAGGPPGGAGGPGGPGGPGGGPGGQGDPAQFVQRLMESDANKDGKLSKDEVPDPIAERIFERADTNKDGFLEKEELVVFAQSQPERGGNRGGRGAQGQSFGGGMKAAGRAMEALQHSPFDASSKAADLEAVQTLQSGLIASKGQASTVPMSDNAKAKFGEDKAAYVAALRMDLLDVIADALTLERAIVAGKTADAKAVFGKIGQAATDGHKLFQREEEEEDERAPRGGERAPARGATGTGSPAAPR